MDFSNIFLREVKEYFFKIEDFILDMNVELAHDYLFLTPHFPVFFILQAILYCTEVRRRKYFSWWKSLIISGLSCFLGRSIVAWILSRDPPLLNNPYYLPIFLMIWFLVNFSPGDFVLRFLSTRFVSFISQILILLIQVREITHGADLGFHYSSNSPFGAILFSFILSSSECLCWNLISSFPSRYFGIETILRNILISIIYTYYNVVIIPDQNPDITFENNKDTLRMILLCFCGVVLLFNCICFGINGTNSVDFSFLTYLERFFFNYKGGGFYNQERIQINEKKIIEK